MRWISRNRRDTATAVSVLLSILIGLIGNSLVSGWYWGLAAFFVVLSVCLAGLEILRRRLDVMGQITHVAPGVRSDIDRSYLVETAMAALKRYFHAIAAATPNVSPGRDLGALVAARLQAENPGDTGLLTLALRPDDQRAFESVSRSLADLLERDGSFVAELLARVAPDANEAAWSRDAGRTDPSLNVTADQLSMRDSVIAAGNVDQSRRTTRIGGAGILVAALLLGGGVIEVGRIATGAGGQEIDSGSSRPQGDTIVTSSRQPVSDTTSRRPSSDNINGGPQSTGDNNPQPFDSGFSLVSGSGGQDIDRDEVTVGLDDASYHELTGLSMLNNAGLATLPPGRQFSFGECSKIPAGSWVPAIEGRDLRIGLHLCLRTSDGILGSLSLDDFFAGRRGVSFSYKLWY